MTEIPKKLLIVGGGVIGFEMAAYFQEAVHYPDFFSAQASCNSLYKGLYHFVLLLNNCRMIKRNLFGCYTIRLPCTMGAARRYTEPETGGNNAGI